MYAVLVIASRRAGTSEWFGRVRPIAGAAGLPGRTFLLNGI